MRSLQEWFMPKKLLELSLEWLAEEVSNQIQLHKVPGSNKI